MISFKGRHFPKDMILMAVRWKIASPLSYRNIEEIMEERGAEVDHSTIQKWVVHYAPKLEASFRKRNRAAACTFFRKAIGSSGMPGKINIDKSGSNTAALERINTHFFLCGLWHLLIEIRRIKYLNNMVEQDHLGIKRVTRYTLGFKSFAAAEATIAGIELHRMLTKGQWEYAGSLPAWKQFYGLAA